MNDQQAQRPPSQPETPEPESSGINLFEELSSAIKDGLDFARDIGGDIWDAATPAFEKGASELVSVAYRGEAHVLYGNTANGPEQQDRDEPLVELTVAEPEVEPDELER